jgi:glycosyltransferase involved in cell wall biosynthesis
MGRLRVAYYSPLPPARSGIADYSAELLQHLAEHLDLELIVDDGFHPDPSLAALWPVHGSRALAALLAQGRFDVVLYHVGNNADYHAEIVRTLRAHPGVVVLHECMLHHLVRGMTIARGGAEGAAGYIEAMRYSYGPTGESLARRSVGSGIPLDGWSFPLFEPIVDASLGLIVHNATTRDRVLASRPDLAIALVPHHLSLGRLAEPGSAAPSSGSDPSELRRTLGIPPEAIVFASFGFITPAKRLEVSLRAFARLRREVPEALYLLVGEVSPHYDFAAHLPAELAQGVIPVERTDLERFLLYMSACDVAINLRYPTAGETSGTLIRLLGMGKPVVVSRLGAFAEIPDDCCAKIDLDETEEDLLFTVLHRLATDRHFRERMGENARRHLAAHHTLAGSARGYAEFLRERVEAKARPSPSVPPLAPYPSHDLVAELSRIVGAEAFDLGVGEGDDEVLGALAGAMAELGWEGDGKR